FKSVDNGVYTASLLADQIRNLSGDSFPAGKIFTFEVDIPPRQAIGVEGPAGPTQAIPSDTAIVDAKYGNDFGVVTQGQRSAVTFRLLNTGELPLKINGVNPPPGFYV